jgi:hypothetical protein
MQSICVSKFHAFTIGLGQNSWWMKLEKKNYVLSMKMCNMHPMDPNFFGVEGAIMLDFLDFCCFHLCSHQVPNVLS